MGTFIVLAVLFVASAVIIGGAVLASIVLILRKSSAPVSMQRILFVALGTIILSPALAPAGTIAAIPLPLVVLLIFTRSTSDIAFLVHQWRFLMPSMVVTATICCYIAWRVFPNQSSKRTRAPRAA
ncbi:MAG: hypothetical protein KGN77_06760 [Xanthomonadaceae bacterium]|nr:hypothetical protein [Xanthomonadaceae bacterium]MDE1963941.1 hypothetical protein [Xanthomonadaceae bacterium]